MATNKMKLWRNIYTPKQTQGHLYIGNRILATLELPWLGNKTGVSCIPSATYPGKKTKSKRLGIVTPEIFVPSRTGIRIHPANYASQLEGCIAPGMGFYDINQDGLFDVVNSKTAFGIIMDLLADDFEIEIRAGE